MRLFPPAAALTALLLPLLAGAADLDSALKAYGAQNYDAAYQQFSQLATQGDNRAKSFLAMMTLRGQGVTRDVKRGAQLARECADGGEPTCAAIYAELQLPVDLVQARTWTRKAIAGGDLRAGYLLWQAYQLDPANQYLVNGKTDTRKYDQLAHRSVAQRADQIEAIDALAGAAAAGHVLARLQLASLLIEQSGAGTTRQIRSLLDGVPDLPDNFRKYLALAQQVDTLGPSRAAPRLIADTIPAVMAGAAAAATRAGVGDAPSCKDFRLMSISAVGDISNVTWLPLKHTLVAGTYPLTGSWQEQWHVFFCNAERTLTMRFDVDGMGGAYYHVIQ